MCGATGFVNIVRNALCEAFNTAYYRACRNAYAPCLFMTPRIFKAHRMMKPLAELWGGLFCVHRCSASELMVVYIVMFVVSYTKRSSWDLRYWGCKDWRKPNAECCLYKYVLMSNSRKFSKILQIFFVSFTVCSSLLCHTCLHSPFSECCRSADEQNTFFILNIFRGLLLCQACQKVHGLILSRFVSFSLTYRLSRQLANAYSNSSSAVWSLSE